MTQGRIKKIFIVIWVAFLLLALFIEFEDTPRAVLTGKSPLTIVSFIQKLAGIWAFVMMSFQVPIGAFMDNLEKRLGDWVYKFHLTEGAIIYSLVLTHVLSYMLFLFIATKVLAIFYIFTDFCLLCKTRQELFYTFGRIAFWFVSIAVMAAVLRKKPWWKNNWRYFHRLNYIVYPLIATHTFFIGSDTKNPLFIGIFVLGVGFYAITVIIKTKSWLVQNISN